MSLRRLARRSMSPACGLLLALALLMTPLTGEAKRSRLAASFDGKVVTSPLPLAPSGEEQQFFTYLKEKDRKRFTKPAQGPYLVHLIAFFARPIGDSQCHVALYELKGPKDRGGRFVEAFMQQVTPRQRNLATKVELHPDRFPPGHYELRVTRVVRGKEKVFAKTRIRLR